MTVAQSWDLWVYCTSICPGNAEAAVRLARRIHETYDTVTEISDVDAFAIRLGIDFAIALNPLALGIAASKFEKLVHVHHGPVTYEDHSGVVRSPVDFFKLGANSRTGFTKPESYSFQSEYRFALLTAGKQKRPTFCLPTSDELRRLTELRN